MYIYTYTCSDSYSSQLHEVLHNITSGDFTDSVLAGELMHSPCIFVFLKKHLLLLCEVLGKKYAPCHHLGLP